MMIRGRERERDRDIENLRGNERKKWNTHIELKII